MWSTFIFQIIGKTDWLVGKEFHARTEIVVQVPMTLKKHVLQGGALYLLFKKKLDGGNSLDLKGNKTKRFSHQPVVFPNTVILIISTSPACVFNLKLFNKLTFFF